MRPATKADAAEIALLVNIATHGGTANGWSYGDEAEGTYDPIEVGRLDSLNDDHVFSWRNATMAESSGEVVGMLLGYSEPESPKPIAPDTPPFFVPLIELEHEAAGRWFISMLGVHVRWRGRGVGSQLLGAAGERRDKTEANGLALITDSGNDGAQRLYRRHGFAIRNKRAIVSFDGSGPSGGDWLLMVKE